MSASETRANKPSSKTFLFVLTMLLVLAVGTSAFLFWKYRHEAGANPANRQERLVKELALHMEMPRDKPIISTVLDRSKLTNKNLAARAHDGDVIFIFPDSKRLILYRPDDGKIVDMMNIRP